MLVSYLACGRSVDRLDGGVARMACLGHPSFFGTGARFFGGMSLGIVNGLILLLVQASAKLRKERKGSSASFGRMVVARPLARRCSSLLVSTGDILG
jgi:hypothetical protein